MKPRLSLFLVFCILWTAHTTYASAQTESSAPRYLFEEFQDGTVFYSDGRQFVVPLNFNLVTGQYVFIDPSDQLEKEFSEPGLVVALHFGERIFLPSAGKAIEIIQAEPKFHVHYSAQKRKAPDKITYGGTTETASIASYSGIPGQGVISRAQAKSSVVTRVDKTYEVKVGKRSRSFYNQRSFLKAFPKAMRSSLESYIQEQEIDFDSVDEVLQLYNYAIQQ